MSSSAAVVTTFGAHDYVEPLARVAAAAFSNDVFVRSIILYEDSAPNDTVISQERWLKHWIPNIAKKIDRGAQIIEAGNWAAAALWFPPGIEKPPVFNPDETPPHVVEYLEKFGRAKAQHLGDRTYWNLSIIGRHPDRKEPGVVRAVIDPILRRADHAGLPAWVEAGNQHARDVYVHLGFRLVEDVTIGEGLINEEGNFVEGGKGLTLYGLIYEPQS